MRRLSLALLAGALCAALYSPPVLAAKRGSDEAADVVTYGRRDLSLIHI